MGLDHQIIILNGGHKLHLFLCLGLRNGAVFGGIKFLCVQQLRLSDTSDDPSFRALGHFKDVLIGRRTEEVCIKILAINCDVVEIAHGSEEVTHVFPIDIYSTIHCGIPDGVDGGRE